jgi:hypothetical protein
MATYRSDRRATSINPPPTEDEATAIAAVLGLLLSGLPVAVETRASRWALAGRLEALGLPSNGRALHPGWRR